MDAGVIYAAKKVIAMASDNVQHKRDHKALSVGDLAQAIERRQIPALRDGDEYVVRASDVRKLRARAAHEPEAMPSRETLEMGRTA